MKKSIVAAISIFIVVIAVIFSVMYLRGDSGQGLTQEEQKENQMRMQENKEMADTPGQAGEADEVSKAFAAKLKEKKGQEVDAKNIVSTGQSLTSGQFLLTVNEWKVSKEYPGYEAPDGVDLETWPGAELDQNGNITNGFSYVTVDISAENLKEEAVSELIWGMIQLCLFDTEDYIGETDYIGREERRESGKDYFRENFQPNETKHAVLIFVVDDKYLTEQEMYLEVNPSGAVIEDPAYDVRRYIILNG